MKKYKGQGLITIRCTVVVYAQDPEHAGDLIQAAIKKEFSIGRYLHSSFPPKSGSVKLDLAGLEKIDIDCKPIKGGGNPCSQLST
jgi:hypothetical protein